MSDEPLEVLVDKDATADEIAGVEDAFRTLGLEVEVVPAMEARSAAEVPWIVLISGAAAVALFNRLLGRSADDLYDALKGWIGGIRGARGRGHANRRGSIDVRGTELALLFPHDVSDDAIRKLVGLDLKSYPPGTLLAWDSREERWVET